MTITILPFSSLVASKRLYCFYFFTFKWLPVITISSLCTFLFITKCNKKHGCSSTHYWQQSNTADSTDNCPWHSLFSFSVAPDKILMIVQHLILSHWQETGWRLWLSHWIERNTEKTGKDDIAKNMATELANYSCKSIIQGSIHTYIFFCRLIEINIVCNSTQLC